MWYAILYIASVVCINLAFSVTPLLVLPGGESWSPVSLAVGFVFVIRDYAQRETGHRVLPAMFTGGGISGLMADPGVAVASICAFLIGEFLDWGVYSVTGRPFAQRILLSSAFSTPVDSAVFLAMLGLFSVPGLLLMTASKMAGAFIVFLLARNPARR